MSPDSKGEVLGKHKFYDQFVTKSLPVVLRNDCAGWNFKKAIDLEVENKTLPEYLSRKFSEKSLVAFTELKKGPRDEFQQGVGQAKTYNRNYTEFTRLRSLNNKAFLHFIQDLPLTPYRGFVQLFEDMKVWLKVEDNIMFTNSLLNELYRPRNRLYTQWTDFRRVPVRNVFEQHVCVVRGTEEYRLISPIFR